MKVNKVNNNNNNNNNAFNRNKIKHNLHHDNNQETNTNTNSDSNSDSDSDVEGNEVTNGYCHYNENNNDTFLIKLCDVDLNIIQKPGGHEEYGHVS